MIGRDHGILLDLYEGRKIKAFQHGNLKVLVRETFILIISFGWFLK